MSLRLFRYEGRPIRDAAAAPAGAARGADMSGTELSAGVAGQVISVASEALGRMPRAQVPPSLRKSASFAPARRSKLVGRQILEALRGDEEFREHLAVQVRTIAPGIVDMLTNGQAPIEVELSEAAAVAYLMRCDGWEELVDRAAESERRRDADSGQTAAAVQRLESQLAQVRLEFRQQRD